MRKIRDTITLLSIVATVCFALDVALAFTIGLYGRQLDSSMSRADSLRACYIELRDSLHQIRLEKEHDEELFIRALMIVESENAPHAVGDNGKAVGVLQLWPGVIEDVRTAGYDYSLADRYSPQKSVEIWKTWQSIYNPQKDLHWALKLQNPRSHPDYHRRVMRVMQILKEQE